MSAAKFDPTINLGHILTFVGMLIGAAGIFAGMRMELGIIDQRMIQVEKSVDKLGNILVADSRQDVRLDALDKRLDRCEARFGVPTGR